MLPNPPKRFVVGRITRDGSRVVVLRPAAPAVAPIPGPWDLRAITAATLPQATRPPVR
jgi:hypothetical protein